MTIEPPALPRVDGLARWVAGQAPHQTIKALFPAFCGELAARGFPIWRGSLALEVLHPEVSGWLHVWTGETASVRQSDRATAATSSAYLDSPTRIVDETERTFRARLDGPSAMPLLEELRQEGATDYVMFPLPFLDRTRTAVMSFATRALDGFGEEDLQDLEWAARILSPYAERQVLRRIAADLLDTYVGPRTGSRIFEGRVSRGEVEEIEAALWFTDLRGFTRLSEEAPIGAVIGTLNTWFGAMGEVIEAHGGEILKFIGDAVLAIFPIGPGRARAAACRDALAAANDFCARSDTLSRERAAAGAPPLGFGLALHVGHVAYGNVGAARRLDFTVIGPAVNRASRLQGLAKELGRRVLLSGAFAEALDQPLVDLGLHALRGIPEPQRVFGLP
jgi:adenylate cyclase